MFVLKKTYDAKVAELEIVSDVLAETQAAERRLSVGLNDWKARATDWEAKFKQAITDLADKSLALCDTQAELRATESLLINAENERDAFRPDALAMRRKRRMDRDRKAAKKEGGL